MAPHEQGAFLHRLATNYYDQDNEKSLALARLALQKSSNAETRHDCLMLLAEIYLDQHRIPAADSLITQALLIASELAEPQRLWRSQLAQAKLKSRQGEWSISQDILEEITPRARAAGDSLLWAEVLTAKGENLTKISAYEKALQVYYQVLSIYRKLEDQYRISAVLSDIGLILMDLKRLPEARKELQRSFNISQEINDKVGITIGMLNLGVVNEKMGDPVKAIGYYKQALKMAHSLQMPYDVALLNANLGTTALELSNYDSARHYLQRAIFIKDTLGLWYDLPHTLSSMGDLYVATSQYDSAIMILERALELAQRGDDLDQLTYIHKQKAEIHDLLGDHATAYHHLYRHKILSDSLFSQRSDEAISHMKIQYETAEKEEQIAGLAAENEKSKKERSIFLVLAILILTTTSSLLYALSIRRNRDKALLAKEKELHRLQNNFFANISHEFRTPLTLILGPAQSLINQMTAVGHRRLLRTIQKNARRLLFLINQILDLTKLDHQELKLKKVRFNLTIMLGGVCSSFDSLAEDRHIDYSYDTTGRAIYFVGDLRRLEVVVINLLANAFKFTPDSGKVHLALIDQPLKKQLLIKVSDTGCGIADANLERIFDRYYHDDRKALSQFEGAGIGLALSKQIVDLHKGSLKVKSEVGKGSEFTVRLPWEDDPGVPAIIWADSFENSGEVPVNNDENINPGQKPILLLVEDRKDMREYLQSFLNQQYQVLEAPDAARGWELAVARVPDLLISDVMMPGESGVDFCKRLKNDVRTSHIPVVLLTAKAGSDDRIAGLSNQADAYVVKPFNPLELKLKLNNLLAHQQKMRQYFETHHRLEPERMSFNSIDKQFLDSLKEVLDGSFDDTALDVEQLASRLSLSRSQLHRKLKALTGQSPNQLIRSYRLTRAYDMVSGAAANISEIAYQVGFSSPAYFSKCFLEEFGSTPTEVRDTKDHSL